MNLGEACRRLGIGNSEYVRRACVSGRIRATKDEQGRWDIPESEIERYLADRAARRAKPVPRTRTRVDDLLERSRGAVG